MNEKNMCNRCECQLAALRFGTFQDADRQIKVCWETAEDPRALVQQRHPNPVFGGKASRWLGFMAAAGGGADPSCQLPPLPAAPAYRPGGIGKMIGTHLKI
jgi:hypothetical protein